jgi:hypothetical protein
MDAAVVTGVFTIAGVAVTGVVALMAAWLKYRTDTRQELRRERREVYARFQHASANLWYWFSRASGSGADSGDLRERDAAWTTWGAVYAEMSIVASNSVWHVVEPLLGAFRRAYFDNLLPPEGHELELHELMRRDIGR